MVDQTFSGRLTQLVRTGTRSLLKAAAVSGLPLAGAIAGIASVTSIDTVEMSPWFRNTFGNAGNSTMMLGYAAFYIPLFSLSLAIGIAVMYLLLKARFDSSYRLARSILEHTDVPQLIAEGQVLEVLSLNIPPLPAAYLPDTSEARRSVEEQIKLAAAYLQPLYAFASAGDRARADQRVRPRDYLDPLKLNTYRAGAGCSGPVLGCPFNFGLSCLLGPPVVIFATLSALPFAEYLGNLRAICEYMLEGMADQPER